MKVGWIYPGDWLIIKMVIGDQDNLGDWYSYATLLMSLGMLVKKKKKKGLFILDKINITTTLAQSAIDRHK